MKGRAPRPGRGIRSGSEAGSRPCLARVAGVLYSRPRSPGPDGPTTTGNGSNPQASAPGALAVGGEPVLAGGRGEVAERGVDLGRAGGAGPLALDAFLDEFGGPAVPLARGEAVAQRGEVPGPRVVRVGLGHLEEEVVGLPEFARLEELDALVHVDGGFPRLGLGRGGGGLRRRGDRGGGLLAVLLDLVAERGELLLQRAQRLVYRPDALVEVVDPLRQRPDRLGRFGELGDLGLERLQVGGRLGL